MEHIDSTIHAIATINHNDEPRRIALHLYRDEDGAYRWYEAETGADCEVSGNTIDAAKKRAESAWGGPDWELRHETTLRAPRVQKWGFDFYYGAGSSRTDIRSGCVGAQTRDEAEARIRAACPLEIADSRARLAVYICKGQTWPSIVS